MSFRFAVVTAAFVSAISAASLFAPSRALATTGGCTVPSLSASIYVDEFFTFTFSSDVPNCRKQCSELLSACNAVVRASDKCVKAAVDGFFDAEKVGCKDLEQPEENQCKSENKDDVDGFLGFLQDDLSDGLSTCEAAGDSCEAACQVV